MSKICVRKNVPLSHITSNCLAYTIATIPLKIKFILLNINRSHFKYEINQAGRKANWNHHQSLWNGLQYE